MINLIACIFLFLPFFSALAQQHYQTGEASFYANKFDGRKTASGELFDNDKLTAAHRTYAFGTKVIVRNLRNKKTVVVTINDRGPFIKGRIIDVSQKAAKQLGFYHQGIAPVAIKIFSNDEPINDLQPIESIHHNYFDTIIPLGLPNR